MSGPSPDKLPDCPATCKQCAIALNGLQIELRGQVKRRGTDSGMAEIRGAGRLSRPVIVRTLVQRPA